MNEPIKFQRLHEIAALLHERLNALQLGQLDKVQLEALTDQSRELYERLVVLRFKAYDSEMKTDAVTSASSAVSPKPEPPKPEHIPFRIAVPQQETAKPPIVQKNIFEEEKPVAPAEKSYQEKSQSVANTFIIPTESVAEKLAKTIPVTESLAQKHESTPISDLKKAITLNQRFQFSKELFKGDNQDYEMTIERLNTTSREDAMRTLDVLRSKYAWNSESPAAIDFTDLVQRRFPQS